VSSASFSPDGTRIASVSADATAKVWDVLTGTLQLDVNLHSDSVDVVSFSPDGTRIVTDDRYLDQTPKVWDARTGRELRDEPIPHAPQPVRISQDGRFFANVVGSRVQLIPLQPDADEISYRLLQAEPNFGRYREGYEAARAANDQFAARFYRDRLPLPDRTRLSAEEIVSPLFARMLLRDEVLAALQAQPAADPEVQAACLKLVGTWPESALECNNVAWSLVRDPGQPESTHRRALRLAETAGRLEPDNGSFLNTLGVAQYRNGLLAEALATLTRSNDLNKGQEPTDLAFLALAQHRLGQSEKARTTLGRLRELMKNPRLADDQESQAFLHEAETIELDRLFPADPFAP
jgi:tetratricopeptide (TPR) repeat protein